MWLAHMIRFFWTSITIVSNILHKMLEQARDLTVSCSFIPMQPLRYVKTEELLGSCKGSLDPVKSIADFAPAANTIC